MSTKGTIGYRNTNLRNPELILSVQQPFTYKGVEYSKISFQVTKEK